MAYQLGALTGGILLALLVMSLLRWGMGRIGFRGDAERLAVPAAIFLVLATVTGGYGLARGDEGPQFLRALQLYAPPAILVTLLFAFLDHRARKRRDGAGTDGAA